MLKNFKHKLNKIEEQTKWYIKQYVDNAVIYYITTPETNRLFC